MKAYPYPIITNLKDFVSLYELHKSDVEIASLLDISIDKVRSVRKDHVKRFSISNRDNKQIETIL